MFYTNINDRQRVILSLRAAQLTLVQSAIFHLGVRVNTKLIYNEQEEIFTYLFVGISISFWGTRVAIFQHFTTSQKWPVEMQNLASLRAPAIFGPAMTLH